MSEEKGYHSTETDEYGNLMYHNKYNELHHEGGPAIVWKNGTKEWYINGKHHRIDGPAIKNADGEEKWYQNGELHRLDGPAIIYEDGHKEWYYRGKRHREDGPAVDDPVYKGWYIHGKRHNDNGPAIIWKSGNEEWYKNDQLHREDGPAMVRSNGDEAWYVNGKLHREGGPAIKNVDGEERWHINGELHREDGPAITFSDGSTLWYYRDQFHREDGPAAEYKATDKHPAKTLWYRYGKLHRLDGPAIIEGDSTMWYKEGKLHRDGGPAVEKPDGTKEWWINGKIVNAEYPDAEVKVDKKGNLIVLKTNEISVAEPNEDIKYPVFPGDSTISYQSFDTINLHPLIKHLIDTRNFITLTQDDVYEYASVAGFIEYTKIPLAKLSRLIVSQTVPMETILKQTKWYSKPEFFPLLYAIDVYINSSYEILADARLMDYKTRGRNYNEKNFLIQWLYFAFSRRELKKLITTLELENINITNFKKFKQTCIPLLDQLYLNEKLIPTWFNMFKKWGVNTRDQTLDAILPNLSNAQLNALLYRGIMISPRSPREFTVFRYSGDYEAIVDKTFRPLIQHPVGSVTTTNSILSVAYVMSEKWRDFTRDKECSHTCCIYVIKVPANFPCLFINTKEYEMLLPPYCQLRIDRFRLKDKEGKPPMIIKEVTPELLKKLCKSDRMLIIDFTIVGLKKED
jgi:hypothetical protein